MSKKTPSVPAGKTPLAPREKIVKSDADDLVHSKEEGPQFGDIDKDPDDAVHQLKNKLDETNELADPDDLVHDADDVEQEDH